MSFPMYSPVKKVKERVIKKIDSGEIKIGREVVQTTYSRYVARTAHTGKCLGICS